MQKHNFWSVFSSDFLLVARPHQALKFINQRALPVSTRTLTIVNSSPVLWWHKKAAQIGMLHEITLWRPTAQALDGPIQFPANYFVSGVREFNGKVPRVTSSSMEYGDGCDELKKRLK